MLARQQYRNVLTKCIGIDFCWIRAVCRQRGIVAQMVCHKFYRRLQHISFVTVALVTARTAGDPLGETLGSLVFANMHRKVLPPHYAMKSHWQVSTAKGVALRKKCTHGHGYVRKLFTSIYF